MVSHIFGLDMLLTDIARPDITTINFTGQIKTVNTRSTYGEEYYRMRQETIVNHTPFLFFLHCRLLIRNIFM